MCKVCLASRVLLLSCWWWALHGSLVLAQKTPTTALGGHRDGGVDHNNNTTMAQQQQQQYAATKHGAPTVEEVLKQSAPATSVSRPTPKLLSIPRNYPIPTKVTKSLIPSRNKRADDICVQPDGDFFDPDTPVTITSSSATLHVLADNKPFTVNIDLSVSASLDKMWRDLSSEALGVTRNNEWSSIAVEVNKIGSVTQYWRIQVNHGQNVTEDKWLTTWLSNYNSMTVTVRDCVKWYHGEKRSPCDAVTNVTTSSQRTPTTRSPGTAVTSAVKSSNSTFGVETNDQGEPHAGQQHETIDPLYWQLGLPLVILALVLVVVVVAVTCLHKKKIAKRNFEIALAIETASQPRDRHYSINSLYGMVASPVQRHESINSLYNSNDVHLNVATGAGTWSASSPAACQDEGIYEN